MQTLNSVHSRGMTATIAGIGALAIAVILLLSFGPFFSSAAGTTVTVQTSATSYTPNTAGGVSIPISGTVTPAPTASGYAVTLEISNTNGLSFVVSTSVAATTGDFSYNLVTGPASGNWVNGTYTVTAVYQTAQNQPTYTGSTTFQYGTSTSTTTTTSGQTGFTTTIITTVSSITTVNSATTVTVNSATTLTSVTTLVSSFVTTVTSNVSSSSTALYIAIVGVIIAIIAGAIAAMALRKH